MTIPQGPFFLSGSFLSLLPCHPGPGPCHVMVWLCELPSSFLRRAQVSSLRLKTPALVLDELLWPCPVC